MAKTDPNKVMTRSADSNAGLFFLESVETIINGTDAVTAAGDMFLPRLPKETDEQFTYRLSVAKFTNIYSDIVENLAAKPFEEEIKLVEGTIPEAIETFIEDTDGDGNNITVFSSQVFFNGINEGIAWIFVDYPVVPETVRTLADARAARIRPYWSIVLHKNILDARVVNIGGETVLSYIKIYEPGSPDHVRIFERTDTGAITWELWKIENNVATVEDEGTLTIDEIPLVPLILGRRVGKRFHVRPPLKAAVELQRILYRQESALEFAKHMTAFPMLSASGVKPQTDAKGNPVPVIVGPSAVLYAPRDGNGQVGSWAYIEPSAQSLKFLAEDIKETKQDLRELGRQPLTAQSGLTVITTAYAAGKSKSAVKQWGNALKDALENALVITCKWFKIQTAQYDPEVSVYDDYDDLTQEDFTAVQGMRDSKDISRETLWKEASRRGILSAEFDPDKEAAAILKETPSGGEDEFETPTTNQRTTPNVPQV